MAENRLCMTWILKSIETCFMTPNMVNLRNCPLCTWKEFVFCCCWVFNKYLLGQVGWLYCSSLLCLYWFPVYSINDWKRGAEISYYPWEFVYFSLITSLFVSCILKLCYFLIGCEKSRKSSGAFKNRLHKLWVGK